MELEWIVRVSVQQIIPQYYSPMNSGLNVPPVTFPGSVGNHKKAN